MAGWLASRSQFNNNIIIIKIPTDNLRRYVYLLFTRTEVGDVI